MDFAKFVEWAFYGIVGGCSVYGVNVLAQLKDSVSSLNEKMAAIIERTTNHEKRLDKHDEQIENLRNK